MIRVDKKCTQNWLGALFICLTMLSPTAFAQSKGLLTLDAFTDAQKALNAISLPKAYYGVYAADKKECASIKEQQKAGIDAEATHINELGVVHVPVSTCQMQKLDYEGGFVRAQEQCFSEGEEQVRTVKYRLDSTGTLTMYVGKDKKPWVMKKCD